MSKRHGPKPGFMPPPQSLANLRPYLPGTNGHGRVYPLKERLQHALDKPLKAPSPDAPHGDVIVYNTLKGAAELVPVAFHETWDRVEGKVPGDGVAINFNEIKILIVREEPRVLPIVAGEQAKE